MQKFFMAISIASVVSGCASVNVQPIDSKSVAALKNQSLSHTKREKPNFAAMTAGKAAFALIGAVAMISEGNKIVKESDVPDPANSIAVGLVKALGEKYGTKFSGNTVLVTTDEADRIADASRASAKFVLDVETVNWSFVYFPTNWARYRVIYTAKARLIDTEAKKVVAEGFCKRIPESDANAPSYDDLVGNSAAGLKSELSLAAEECINSLRKEMLGETDIAVTRGQTNAARTAPVATLPNAPLGGTSSALVAGSPPQVAAPPGLPPTPEMIGLWKGQLSCGALSATRTTASNPAPWSVPFTAEISPQGIVFQRGDRNYSEQSNGSLDEGRNIHFLGRGYLFETPNSFWRHIGIGAFSKSQSGDFIRGTSYLRNNVEKFRDCTFELTRVAG
jgi:hypothetical protein